MDHPGYRWYATSIGADLEERGENEDPEDDVEETRSPGMSMICPSASLLDFWKYGICLFVFRNPQPTSVASHAG